MLDDMRFPFTRRLSVASAQGVEVKDVTLPEVKSVPSIAYPDAALLELFGIAETISGENFSPDIAWQCTAVRCAVQVIAETIGALPIHTFALAPDNTRERDRANPLDRFLAEAVNGWMPASEFREALTRDALLYGRGLAYINRASDGRVLELQRLIPGTVSLQLDTETGEPSYLVNGQARTLAAGDVIDIRAPYTRLPIAQSPTLDAREAIGLALALERHAAQLFARGARPAGVLSFPKALTAEALARARAVFAATHSGRRSGGTAVIDDGATFTQTAFTSVDGQFVEQRKFAIEEIARAYRVPPHMLYEMGRATWGNSEEMGRQFLTYTLRPWLTRWESELNLKLFVPGSRQFVEFRTDDLLRADTVQRFEAYSKAIAARILNANEVRELENRAPYAGGEAFVNPAIQTADVGR